VSLEVKQKISRAKVARHAAERVAFPPLLVGWKICTRCKERKHYDFTNLPDTFASDYSPLKSKNADDTVTIRPASRCKRCQAAVKAERYEQLSDEERRKLSKKINEQRDQEARREYARLYDERKRREAGVEPRNFKDGRNRESKITVDATPLREFLLKKTRSKLEEVGTARVNMGVHRLPTITDVAEVIDLNSDHLWKVRTGRDAQNLLVFWYPQTNLERG
jgi:hypothetical protein